MSDVVERLRSVLEGQYSTTTQLCYGRSSPVLSASSGADRTILVLACVWIVAIPALGCGGWWTHNRREFSDTEKAHAEGNPECVENRTQWECNPPTALEVPAPVASIVIVPDRIFAKAGQTLTVFARLFDEEGAPIPEPSDLRRAEFPAIRWSAEDGIEFTGYSPYHHTAEISVSTPAASKDPNRQSGQLSDPASLVVTAELEDPGLGTKGLVPAAAAVVLTGDGAGSTDMMMDRFSTGALANAGLFSRSAGECSRDVTVAYTGSAPLAGLGTNCEKPAGVGQSLTSVAFFSTEQRFKLLSDGWTTSPVTVLRAGASSGGLPEPEPVFPLPLRVWRGVTTHATKSSDEVVPVSLDDVLVRAKCYAGIATWILSDNRTGFGAQVSESVDAKTDFKIGSEEEKIAIPPHGELVEPTLRNYCRYIAAHVRQGSFGDTDLSPDRHLEVVFVHTSLYRAYACPNDDVVVMLYGGVVPTTLAHEIGHKLALKGDLGHTTYWWNAQQGFTTRNIMWSWEPDDVLQARNHVSLGQVFRMNRHKGSLAKLAPDSQAEVDCGEWWEDAAGNEHCPCLGLDIGKGCEGP